MRPVRPSCNVGPKQLPTNLQIFSCNMPYRHAPMSSTYPGLSAPLSSHASLVICVFTLAKVTDFRGTRHVALGPGQHFPPQYTWQKTRFWDHRIIWNGPIIINYFQMNHPSSHIYKVGPVRFRISMWGSIPCLGTFSGPVRVQGCDTDRAWSKGCERDRA